MVVIILRSRRRYLYQIGSELRSKTGRRQRREGGRLDASAEETGLKLLISRQTAQIDGGLAVKRGRGWAVVERLDSVTRHRACHQSAVIAPVETNPRPALPRSLVLQVGSLIEDFVVINAERRSALAHGHA